MGELDLAVTGGRGMEKLCVIKRVLPHLLESDNVQRFREEATMVVRLSHGNLVGVLDAGREEDEFYLAMDFVEGKDLLATWNQCAARRIAFPIEIAAYVVKELARGLGYAHSYRDLQLVHRDISPANVLLSYSGEVKLTDFGLATSRLKEQRTAPGIIFGKLSYLAPEQARGETLDRRTDLYAAGILLWEMLTGQQLFPVRQDARQARASASQPEENASNPTLEALDRVRNPSISPPSSLTSRVPPELDAIAMCALAINPAERYQSGEALRSDLGSFLAKNAPETDAASLATFMAVLFREQIEAERQERDKLLEAASPLLSGAHPVVRQVTPVSSNPLADKGSTAPPADPVATTGNAGLRAPGSGERSGNPDDDRRVGTTLEGRYFLRRLCGEGAMGRVYEAHHVEIGRRVAIKILHPTFRHTPDVVERFRREARSASKIGHPNIVDVTDSGTTTDGAFFFVMEYLDGVNLEQVIARDGSLGLERALLISAQVCRALAGAHAAGIVHRDLKPANVMLVRNRDEEDFVKVLDFGISKQSDLDLAQGAKDVGLTQPDVAVGTPIYMAPEQIAGHPADARTDVYAVGELLYEMLTGKSAFAGKDVMVVFNKKANVDPAPVRMVRPDAPEQLEAMLTRAMARRPDDRFPTMGALKDEIMRCLAHIEQAPVLAPIPLTGTPTIVRPDRRTWRERRNGLPRSLRTYGIVGAGVAAGIIAALLLVVGKDESTREKPPSAEGTHIAAPTTATAERAPPVPTTTAIKVAPPVEAERPVAHDSEPVKPVTAPLARPSVAVATRPPAPPSPQPTRPRSSKAALANVPGPSATASAAATSDALVTSGRAAFAKGDFAQAVRFGRQASTVGDSLGGRLLLGDAFFKMNRYADALREYGAAARMAPTNAQAVRGQQLARQRLGTE